MAEISPEQKEALEKQKEQCPFCKIIKGEIPSHKVYEDDLIIAVLDINPATKGHILVMPKEHYPIMPLIPPETFEHLFAKTKHLSQCLKEGMLVFGDTIFIANGYAAGQQSNHFMLHIIPRDEGDGLSNFEFKKGEIDSAKFDEAFKMLSHNLPIMLRNRSGKFAMPGQKGAPQAVAYGKDEIIKIIEQNPQLKKMILDQPDAFKQQVLMNDQLKQLFEKVDVNEIIKHFNPDAKISEDKTEQPPASESTVGNAKPSVDELIVLLNQNPKLKDMILTDTILFKENVAKVPQINELFGHVEIDELKNRLIEDLSKEDLLDEDEKKEERTVKDMSKDEEEDVLDELFGNDSSDDDKKEDDNEEEKDEEKKDDDSKADKQQEDKDDKGHRGNPSLDGIADLF